MFRGMKQLDAQIDPSGLTAREASVISRPHADRVVVITPARGVAAATTSDFTKIEFGEDGYVFALRVSEATSQLDDCLFGIREGAGQNDNWGRDEDWNEAMIPMNIADQNHELSACFEVKERDIWLVKFQNRHAETTRYPTLVLFFIRKNH